MNAEEEQAHWDHVAGDSARIDANVYGDLDLTDCLLTIEEGFLPWVDGWYLDLGCGPGRLIRPLADKYPKSHWVGVDSSQRMISIASNLAPEVSWVWNNGRDLSELMDNQFDGAYSMTTFQHIPHEAQSGYLAELHRVVKPGGKLRLQFVFEGEPGPLSYPTTVKDMASFADSAGWRDTDITLGRIKPEWAWVTLLNL